MTPGDAREPLLVALSCEQMPTGWSGARWSVLLQQARATGLLGKVAYRLSSLDPDLDACPLALRGHFHSVLRVWAAQQRQVRREVGQIRHALAGLGCPVVLLKGAAYVMSGLPAAHGRLFADVDVMVPRAQLAQAESDLMLGGWMSTHTTAYDQRYYRQWMHEVPPMEHIHRRTTLDLHHTILPLSGRMQPDAAALFADAVTLADDPHLYVLSPPDMVLHSMAHLFVNDELSHALRDLSDLDALLRHFGDEPRFWDRLVERAERHHLARLLYYGLYWCQRRLGTPVPVSVIERTGLARPPMHVGALMNRLWAQAFAAPCLPAARWRAAALFALYLRGHWLRMPPLMLARHLTIKALRLHEPKTDSAARTVG